MGAGKSMSVYSYIVKHIVGIYQYTHIAIELYSTLCVAKGR